MKIRASVFIASVVKALAAAALIAGVVGVTGATSVSAAPLNTFYVSPFGTSNINNTCTTKSVPCLLISHAISVATAANPGGPNTIELAKGTYDQDISLTGTSNMTILGPAAKNDKYTAILDDDVPTVVDVDSSNTGATIENLGIVGGSSSTVGAEVDGVGNELENVSITGISGTSSNAIASNAGTIDNATVSGTQCSDTTKSAIPANAPTGTIVPLSKKIPTCAGTLNDTAVTIGGQSFNVDSAGRAALGLDTANGATTVPADATVVFNTIGIAYNDNGVVCTDCTVENSTIKGNGGAGQVGINATSGGNDNIQGDKVTGQGAFGIAVESSTGVINVGTMAANTVSASGVALQIDGAADASGGTVNAGSMGVTNSYSGIQGGISATCISTDNAQSLNLIGNTVTSTGLEGAGIVFQGVVGSTDTANTVSRGTLGWLLASGQGCPNDVGSSGNVFTTNSVTDMTLFGVLILGPADPEDILLASFEEGLSFSQSGNEPNTFTSNTWSDDGEAGIVDFNAFESPTVPVCSTVVAAAATTPGESVTSVELHEPSVHHGGTTCKLVPGTNLEDSIFTINQELYVHVTVKLVAGGPVKTVPVQNFIPLASSTLDAPPDGHGIAVGDDISTDGFPSGDSATTNTYQSDVPADPSFNGSSSLDAITGSGGYDSA
jgi:hypothetical protein